MCASRHADTSLYQIPAGTDEEALVMLSDILPTGFECGVLNGKVQPGVDRRHRRRRPDRAGGVADGAILFAGRDHHDRSRRQSTGDSSKRFGATATINNKDGKAVDKVMEMTDGRGVDTAIEAVGVPAISSLCEEIVAPGGIIANIGVHGVKADLHLERLWDRNITITTRLVDTVTTPMLLKTVQSRKIDPKKLITHRFKLDKILDAYDTFGAQPRPKR